MFKSCCCAEEQPQTKLGAAGDVSVNAPPEGLATIPVFDDTTKNGDTWDSRYGSVQRASSLPAPAEWTVTLDKPQKTILGVELDLADEEKGFVCAIRPGVIKTYNNSVEDSAQIKPNDWIVKVNGKGGDLNIYEQLKGTGKIELKLVRTSSFGINVSQKEIAPWSLCTKVPEHSITLLIVEMPSLLQDFNKANPDKFVRLRDRILTVNGITGKPQEMLKELGIARNLDITILSQP